MSPRLFINLLILCYVIFIFQNRVALKEDLSKAHVIKYVSKKISHGEKSGNPAEVKE